MIWEKEHQLTTFPPKENKQWMETPETKIQVRAFGYPHCTETGGISQDETAETFKFFISNHCQEFSSVLYFIFSITFSDYMLVLISAGKY